MGLTKKGKILLSSLATLIALASIVVFAVSIGKFGGKSRTNRRTVFFLSEKKHQLRLPREKSGLERLLDIKDSLGRARDKMEELVDNQNNQDTNQDTNEDTSRSRRDVGILT